MNKKKILYFGTPEIAVKPLEVLNNLDNIEIIGVCVFPDRKIGRKQILTSCPVKTKAIKLGLPIFEISSKNDLVKVYENNPVDLSIVIAFGVIFPEIILNLPKFGTINVHFSLLPEYRGASPVQSAILDGKKVSGISFQQMVKSLDAGDILWQKKHNIENKKTSELFDFFTQETANQLPFFLNELFDKKIIPIKQNEKLISLCGKFQKSDGLVNSKKETAQQIYKKYLAFDIFPGIFMETEKGNLNLKKISLIETENSFKLNCSENTSLYLQRIQLQGKKEMDIDAFLRGMPTVLK